MRNVIECKVFEGHRWRVAYPAWRRQFLRRKLGEEPSQMEIEREEQGLHKAGIFLGEALDANVRLLIVSGPLQAWL